MDNERFFNEQVSAGLASVEALDLKTIFSAYEDALIDSLLKKDKYSAESDLTELFFMFIKQKELNHVFTLKLFFSNLVLETVHVLRKKEGLQSEQLAHAIALISTIEQWEEVTKFLTSVPWFVDKIIDKLIPSCQSSNLNPLINKTIQLINDNLRHPILSVKWLAQQLKVTSAHLSYVFRHETGGTLLNYIQQRKMEDIVFQMTYTNLPLKEIYQLYHFKTYSNFIRAFKKYYGVTPSQYKKKVVVNDNGAPSPVRKTAGVYAH